MMHSNSYHNSPAQGTTEPYQEVFKVLDHLGMADLKHTFQEHCIQVFTLYSDLQQHVNYEDQNSMNNSILHSIYITCDLNLQT